FPLSTPASRAAPQRPSPSAPVGQGRSTAPVICLAKSAAIAFGCLPKSLPWAAWQDRRWRAFFLRTADRYDIGAYQALKTPPAGRRRLSGTVASSARGGAILSAVASTRNRPGTQRPDGRGI